jgi:hypothetical protein
MMPSTNSIYIEQVGDNNTYTVYQDGNGHTASISVGKSAPSDNNNINITQQGTGAKTATVEITSGINNGIVITQDGSGNHSGNIQNLNGSANNITISQSGDSGHVFNILGGLGTTNSGNTINATQSGGQGANKSFDLNLNGTSGANVSVTQTNPTQANSGSMSITCSTGSCGSYSYTRY